MPARTSLVIALAAVLVAAGVVVAVLVTGSTTTTSGSGAVRFSTGMLKTACTRALADDMELLVPNNSPITDRPVLSNDVFDAVLCATAEAPQHPPESSHTLAVAVLAYKSGTVGLTASRSCRIGIKAFVADAVRAGGRLVKDPSAGARTAVLSPLGSGHQVMVVGCRGRVAIRAIYQVADFAGPPPKVWALVAATDHFVTKAFDDLGA